LANSVISTGAPSGSGFAFVPTAGTGGGGGDEGAGRFTKVAVTSRDRFIVKGSDETAANNPLNDESFPLAVGTAASLTRAPLAYFVRQTWTRVR
jgi:hypothetical protein